MSVSSGFHLAIYILHKMFHVWMCENSLERWVFLFHISNHMKGMRNNSTELPGYLPFSKLCSIGSSMKLSACKLPMKEIAEFHILYINRSSLLRSMVEAMKIYCKTSSSLPIGVCLGLLQFIAWQSTEDDSYSCICFNSLVLTLELEYVVDRTGRPIDDWISTAYMYSTSVRYSNSGPEGRVISRLETTESWFCAEHQFETISVQI